MRTKILAAITIAAFTTAGCGLAETTPSDDPTGSGDSTSQGTDGAGGAGGVPGAWCQPIPACDFPPPPLGAAVGWNHLASSITAAAGFPNHRGRDLLLNPGDPQWVIAKFAYGLLDKDLKDEEVDLFLLRDCGDSWEPLGTASTTKDNTHAPVEGVKDSGGHVYFKIPPEKALGPGRHRVRLVVRGDLTTTDVFIEVVPPGTPVVVTDVDGTLTGTETEEFTALLSGQLPECHADAAEVLQILATKGYHPIYLTARPEWLVGRTREFVETYNFPPGIVHTTLSLTGALGASAAAYKTGELAALAQRGLVPAWAFGNTATDAEAYDNAEVSPISSRVFYQFDDTVFGGRRIESYTELLAEMEALPSLCE